MFKKISLSMLAAATAMTALPAAADARPSRYPQSHQGYYGDQYQRGGHYQRGDYYRGQRGSYYGSNRGYYGRNRYYGRCRDKGTTGTILGAIAGGLLGKEIAEGGRYHRGDGTTGAIIGGAVGALAGRAIDRDCR